MDSFQDTIKTVLRSIVQLRRTPYITMMFIGSLVFVTLITIKYCSSDPHFKNAAKKYEAGDFFGAVSEAELYLEKDPTNIQALLLLGDAHAAIAETSRSSVPVFREHACAAIRAYKKSMAKGFNNNINTKIVVLEQRSQDLVDSQGRMYGGCPDSEAGSP